jgi:hypothetical protein
VLGAALGFPTNGDQTVKTILVGGVLSLLGGVLLVPLLPVQGLMVRVLRAGAVETTDPPVFENWGDLFVDGLLAFVVQILYVLVPVFVLVVGSFAVGAGAVASGVGADPGSVDAGAGAGLGIAGGLVALVGVLSVLVAVYLLPAALANFAHEEEFTAAFNVRTVARAAFTGEYLVAAVLALVVALTLGAVAAALTVLLIGVFLSFYVQMVVFYLLGRGYGAGLGIEGDGPGPDDGTDSAGPDGRDRPEPDPLS